jgi:TPR repeat protein
MLLAALAACFAACYTWSVKHNMVQNPGPSLTGDAKLVLIEWQEPLRPNSPAFRASAAYRKAEAAFKTGHARAIPLLRPLAEAGDARAQYMLAEMLDDSPATEREAFDWYRKSAGQGDPCGMVNLGWCYQVGAGTARSPAEASECLKKALPALRAAAESGDSLAQNNLGCCYEEGLGVAKDYRQAVEWFRKAAEQGHATAQNNLGYCYEHGLGVAKDEKQAVEWYRKAAEQGFASAQYNLGLCYEYGTGVAKDYKQAVEWFRKAAVRGLPEARQALERLGVSP